MPAKKDLTGMIFGELTVLYELPERKNGKIVWHCRCNCGNEKDIVSTQLTKQNSPTRSCGCLQKKATSESNRAKGLEGTKYGRLTVIERQGNKWLCKCDCGNEVLVPTNHLNTGHTKSCGCLQRDRTSEASLIDLSGQQFGYWTVIERDKSTIKDVKWICQCKCGTIKSVPGKHLKSGDSMSCGCLKMSHGELKIATLLTNANISYKQEVTFDNCINPKTGKLLRFDFFVEDRYLIEYDGKQHFKESNNYSTGWGEEYEDISYRDELKNTWCKENNIPLIRISHEKYDTLSLEDLLL